MSIFRVKLEADGRIILPLELRERLGVAPGQKIELFTTPEGQIILHALVGKAKDWPHLFGQGRRAPPLSIREMDEAVGEALAEENDRILRQRGESMPRGKAKVPAAE